MPSRRLQIDLDTWASLTSSRAMIRTCGWSSAGGREGTPMLKVVHDEAEPQRGERFGAR
jgi:hypothetical protein